MGQRRRLKKQQTAAMQQSAARKPMSRKRPSLLGLLGSLSGVPEPMVVRTPIGVSATVYFAKNSALLDAANFRAVEELAEPLVTVDGHASGEGQEAQNLALSSRRRQTVIALLTQQVKSAPDIKGEAFGEAQPAVPASINRLAARSISSRRPSSGRKYQLPGNLTRSLTR